MAKLIGGLNPYQFLVDTLNLMEPEDNSNSSNMAIDLDTIESWLKDIERKTGAVVRAKKIPDGYITTPEDLLTEAMQTWQVAQVGFLYNDAEEGLHSIIAEVDPADETRWRFYDYQSERSRSPTNCIALFSIVL
ncbi:hypothetical protein FRC12_002742 [Ceratobasidium sp. 428]|nr:hypothetical protein FRC12_002742 [Ceratobasidium sp. 428]